MSNLTETDCITALLQRHREDLFFSHVPIDLKSSRIIDALSLSHSLPTHLSTTGYEIKLSHSDFISDNKWEEYLPFCSRFFFVCPVNIIHKKEIPSVVGLIHIREDGIIRKIKPCPSKPIEFDKLAEFFFTLLIHHTNNSPSIQRLQRIFEMCVLMAGRKAGENLSKIVNATIRERIFSLQNQLRNARSLIKESEKHNITTLSQLSQIIFAAET